MKCYILLLICRLRGEPVLHLGPVAAGRQVSLDDQLRQEFSRRNGIVAFDSELDAVVESIYGNRKDQVMESWLNQMAQPSIYLQILIVTNCKA